MLVNSTYISCLARVGTSWSHGYSNELTIGPYLGREAGANTLPVLLSDLKERQKSIVVTTVCKPE